MSSDPDQDRAALTQSPAPIPRDQHLRPPLEAQRRLTTGTLQSVAEKTSGTLKKQWAKYILLSLVITALAIGISLATAYRLLVNDVNYQIPVEQGQPAIYLNVDLLSVDPIAGTLVLDWYPTPSVACEQNPPGGVFDIYFDPNLIIEDGDPPDDAPPPSNAPASDPTFSFNATTYCKTTLHDSTATFRTTSKLVSDAGSKGSSSLQAYPFDIYTAQISLFVLDNATNGSVRAAIYKTWGVAVNFDVGLGDQKFNKLEGMYFVLNVSRSSAVKLFVMFIVMANWIVTLVFLWITIACLFWQERVVRELFVVPVSVLFAFTAVRSSMPGSPAGFGAFIDFVGILPNLAILTFCSFILLLVVLYQRIVDTYTELQSQREEREANQGLLQSPRQEKDNEMV